MTSRLKNTIEELNKNDRTTVSQHFKYLQLLGKNCLLLTNANNNFIKVKNENSKDKNIFHVSGYYLAEKCHLKYNCFPLQKIN